MKKIDFRDPAVPIGAAGILTLAVLFLRWLISDGNGSAYGHLAALASAGLFAAVCLRYIRPWLGFWSRGREEPAQRVEEPAYVYPLIFLTLLLLDVCIVGLVYLIRFRNGHTAALRYELDFWKCIDSGHYIDIARDWYLREGDTDRLVQLVFLPGYPLLLRLFGLLIPNDVVAGLTASGICFAAAGCFAYALLRLDAGRQDALRTLKFLVLCPGVFFYAAPMSESLFLLLCCACLYFTRRGWWLAGCISGALAAFTRSLGLTLTVPLFFEAIHLYAVRGNRRELALHLGETAAVLLGFGAYMCINYAVSGDFFKFMEYQSGHWHQNLGWFFATADTQVEYAVEAFSQHPEDFWGMWLPNIIAAFFSLSVMLCGVRRLRPSYGAWFIIYYPIAIGATWLLSGPRYLMVLLPVTFAVGRITEKPIVNMIMTVLYIMSGAAYLWLFAMRWNVW